MYQSKACSRCKQIKLISEFNKDKSSPSGFQYKCRQCEREIRRDYYLENKQKEIARVSKWHKTTEKGKINRSLYSNSAAKSKPRPYIPVHLQDEKTKERLRAKATKKRIKRRAYWRMAEKNEVSNAEIKKLLSSACIYCGSSKRITIDHIIPLARGGRHSIGNLAPACHSCNSRKSARFITEWKLNKPRADSLRRTGPRSL